MSRIAKHALLPSLIATAFVAPAAATAPDCRTEQAHVCDRDERSPQRLPAQQRCPHCKTSLGAPRSVHDLLADGTAIEATQKAARSLLGLSPEEAEDAAQEAALRAVAKNVAACCPKGLNRWLFRTAKNFVLDTKRKKREQLLSATETEDLGPMPLPPTADVGPLQILELADEVHATLDRADLGRLSPEKRVQLGRALGDRLQLQRHLPRPAALVDHAKTAVEELAPQG